MSVFVQQYEYYTFHILFHMDFLYTEKKYQLVYSWNMSTPSFNDPDLAFKTAQILNTQNHKMGSYSPKI